ncbi:MAG: SLC13 family permease [Promethearchaeota archaeon]
MTEIVPILATTITFLIIMIIFSKEKMDYVAYSILGALICGLITTHYYGTTLEELMSFLEFEPLIFILSMEIIISMIEDIGLFQWIAVKALHITKGDYRKFFYVISFMAAMSSVFISDITVSLIFFPLLIKACQILELDSATYLFGAGFTINVGSIYSPFSSSENILISISFHKDFLWFIANFTFLVIPLIFLTLIILDKTTLVHQHPPSELKKTLLLETIDPNILIIDKKEFKINTIYFALILFGFMLTPHMFIIAAFGAILMCLLNKRNFVDVIRKIDWKIIFFFISLFIIIGCMDINGSLLTISNFTKLLLSGNLLVDSIIVLLLSSVLSALLANVPTTIIFINLLTNIYAGSEVPNLIIIALLLGVNLGANLLPQGAAKNLIALNLAKKNKINTYNYSILFKKGLKFALFHIAMSSGYLAIMSLIV